MSQYKTIAQLPNYIVLEDYTKYAALSEPPAGYQSEAELEQELIKDLVVRAISTAQTYTRPPRSWPTCGSNWSDSMR